MSTRVVDPQIGEGVYTLSEAASILGRGEGPVTSRRVRYWVSTGLTPASYSFRGRSALSFEDLISLEVVRRFRRLGVSLQRVRRLEERLRNAYDNRRRPMAYEVFFTDGASIWARESAESEERVIEVVGDRPNHYVWVDGIATFADEITFDPETRRASSWTLSPWVRLDPAIQFGEPVVMGSRIPVRTIRANLRVGDPEEVADWYGLSIDQVTGVTEYLASV